MAKHRASFERRRELSLEDVLLYFFTIFEAHFFLHTLFHPFGIINSHIKAGRANQQIFGAAIRLGYLPAPALEGGRV